MNATRVKKNIGLMIINWHFSATKLAKKANYASSDLFREILENYVRNDELCQKLARILCQLNLWSLARGGGGACPLVPVHHFSPQMCSPFLPQKSLIRSSYKCTAKAAPLIDILGANWENLGCPYTSAICFPDTTRFQFSKPLFHLKYTLPSWSAPQP